jgi:hypothetical protein
VADFGINGVESSGFTGCPKSMEPMGILIIFLIFFVG